MGTLDDFRRAKDAWLRESADSPIPPAERAAFEGPRYFPERPDLRLAVRPERFAAPETVLMQTTAGDVQEYQRWGRFTFEVEGQPAALTVYYAPWGEYFVPFAVSSSASPSPVSWYSHTPGLMDTAPEYSCPPLSPIWAVAELSVAARSA